MRSVIDLVRLAIGVGEVFKSSRCRPISRRIILSLTGKLSGVEGVSSPLLGVVTFDIGLHSCLGEVQTELLIVSGVSAVSALSTVAGTRLNTLDSLVGVRGGGALCA